VPRSGGAESRKSAVARLFLSVGLNRGEGSVVPLMDAKVQKKWQQNNILDKVL
jgi:hypothetical protein